MLGSFVFAGDITSDERLAAVTATMRLVARVGPLVRRNGALVAEPPRAHRASQAYGFSLCGSARAWEHVALLREPPGAHRASVRLLARVGPLVRRNGALVAEPPGAHRASVRLLARVGPRQPTMPQKNLLVPLVGTLLLLANCLGQNEQ